MAPTTFPKKLQPPPPPEGHLDRPRVSGLLDASADVPLTVIRAPWCTGKTVAAASWARARPGRVAWATIDRRDRDPATFAQTLAAALGTAGAEGAPDRSGRPAEVVEEAEGAVVGALEQVAGRGTSVTLVLDGAERLVAGRSERLLDDLVDYTPPNLHLVLTAVGHTSASTRRRRLGGQALEVTERDLRLTVDETAELMDVLGRGPVADGDAREVHERAEGHVAVVAAAGRADVAPVRADETWLDEVLWSLMERLRPDLALFVREIAGLPTLAAPLCDAVTRWRGSAALLHELADESGLVVRDEAGRHRFHRALGEALERLVAAEEPDRVHGMRRAAAHWWEAQGHVAEAVDGWLAVGEPAQAWALIGRHQLDVYFASGREAVARWVDAPPPGTTRDPWHAVDRAGVLLMVGRADEAAQWLQQAEALVGTAEEERLLPALGPLRAHCHYLRGDLGAALEQDRPGGPRVRADARAALAAATRVDILTHAGRFEEAERSLAELTTYAVVEGPLATVLGHSSRALLAIGRGRLREAVACAEAALASADGCVGREGVGTEAAHLALGIAAVERGQAGDGIGPLLVAQHTSRRAGITHLAVRATLALARARGLQGRMAEALHLTATAGRPLHGDPLPVPIERWIERAELRLHLLAGDRAEVEHLGARLPADPVEPEDVVLRAWAALVLGDRARAQDLLAAGPGPAASVATTIELDLLRARATGDVVRTRTHLARAVRRGSVDRYVTVFVDHRRDLLPALHDLRATEPSPYLSDLLFVVDHHEAAAPVEGLTDREVQVVARLESERSVERIAQDLGVSVNTLKTHVKAIYRKLGATSRGEAVHRAIVLRIIGPEAGRERATGGARSPTPTGLPLPAADTSR